MLKELKFVQGSVARKDFVPALQHFRIKDGWIKGYNGNLSLCCPIALDLDITPKALPFIKAVETCQQEVSMSLNKAGKLVIKSGRFKALVDCEVTGTFPELEPEGVPVPLPGGLLPVLKKLFPFIADDASRPWARGILLKGGSAFVTNNIVVVEHWLGVPFPLPVSIPKSAIIELLRIGEEPTTLQLSEGSATFTYENGGWLRTQTLEQTWPDLEKIFTQGGDLTPLPEGFFEAVAALSPFVDEQGRIFLLNEKVSTAPEAEEGTVMELPSLIGGSCFNHKHLLSLEPVVKTIALDLYPRPCLFTGENLRGAIVGIRA